MSFAVSDSDSGDRACCAVDKCYRYFHHAVTKNGRKVALVWMTNEDIQFTYIKSAEMLAVGKPVNNGGCQDPQYTGES